MEFSTTRKMQIAQLAEQKAIALLGALMDKREDWPELSDEEFQALKPLLKIKVKAFVEGMPNMPVKGLG